MPWVCRGRGILLEIAVMGTSEQPALTKAQRRQLLLLLVIAPASTLLGFVAVLYFSGGSERLFAETTPAAPVTELDPASDGGVPGSGDGAALESDDFEDPDGPVQFEGLLVRRTPAVKMGDPFYYQCWDQGSDKALENEACERLRPLERLIASRVGEVVRCRDRLDEPNATGMLSLAVDITFEPESGKAKGGAKGKVRYWAGRSTTLKGAEAIITCVRRELEEMPLHAVKHKRQRYKIFFPIEFATAPAKGAGTPVELVLDRVRLRREPVKGKIVARLRRGEPVRVFEVRDGWARIRTVDRREGWVFGEAITVPNP